MPQCIPLHMHADELLDNHTMNCTASKLCCEHVHACACGAVFVSTINMQTSIFSGPMSSMLPHKTPCIHERPTSTSDMAYYTNRPSHVEQSFCRLGMPEWNASFSPNPISLHARISVFFLAELMRCLHYSLQVCKPTNCKSLHVTVKGGKGGVATVALLKGK